MMKERNTFVRTTMTLILPKFCRKNILFSTLSQIVTRNYVERCCNVVLALLKKGVAEYSVSRSYAKHVIDDNWKLETGNCDDHISLTCHQDRVREKDMSQDFI